MAVDRGARVFGLDATEGLIEIARDRVPEADLRVGDLQLLPYEGDFFDIVAGFNSYFLAADMTEALREAGRVAKPGAPVVIQVWGRPERCDLTPMLCAMRSLRRRPERDARPRIPLSGPGVLEKIAADVGLTPEATSISATRSSTPISRRLFAGCSRRAQSSRRIHTSGEKAVVAAIVDSLAPYRKPDGGYRLVNEWHYVVAST